MTCKGCRRSVQAPAEAIQRELDRLRALGSALVSEEECARRIAFCSACEHLLNRDTCRLCGCLLPVRARLLEKGCPRVEAKW
jgi:hypothetical protein